VVEELAPSVGKSFGSYSVDGIDLDARLREVAVADGVGEVTEGELAVIVVVAAGDSVHRRGNLVYAAGQNWLGGPWDQILCRAVVLEARCGITWYDISWREGICCIWTSERAANTRSRSQTWWSLGWLTCD